MRLRDHLHPIDFVLLVLAAVLLFLLLTFVTLVIAITEYAMPV